MTSNQSSHALQRISPQHPQICQQLHRQHFRPHHQRVPEWLRQLWLWL